MRTDYFSELRVPGVPGTSPATGDGANPHKHCMSPPSPASPVKNDKAEVFADPSAPCPTCGCGAFWSTGSGWFCEGCNPPPYNVTRWRQVSGGRRAPMPAAALPWPGELTEALRRVAEHFAWSRDDVRDFCRWARRSPQAMDDAAAFLRFELDKLPAAK